MPDFVFQILIRLAVMLPVVVIAVSVVWYALKGLGIVTPRAPPDPRDVRTWPLRFVLAEAALFALAYAIVIVGLGEGEWTPAIAGGVSAVVALVLGPLIVARLVR